jgi:hypothetical protein
MLLILKHTKAPVRPAQKQTFLTPHYRRINASLPQYAAAPAACLKWKPIHTGRIEMTDKYSEDLNFDSNKDMGPKSFF